MLVLARERDEQIVINKDGVMITITICDLRGQKARIGVDAPSDWAVNRKEIYDEMKKQGEVLPVNRQPNPNRKHKSA